MRGGLLWVVCVVLALPFAHALALSYEYHDQNIIPLPPGTTYYYRLVLQNEEDAAVTANVQVESQIATLVGPHAIELPAKNYDTYVYLNITVPPDAPEGTEFPVRFIVMPAQGAVGEGQVPFAVRYDRSLTIRTAVSAPVPVQEPPVVAAEPSSSRTRVIVIAVAASIAFLLVLLLVWRAARKLTRRAPPRQGPEGG